MRNYFSGDISNDLHPSPAPHHDHQDRAETVLIDTNATHGARKLHNNARKTFGRYSMFNLTLQTSPERQKLSGFAAFTSQSHPSQEKCLKMLQMTIAYQMGDIDS